MSITANGLDELVRGLNAAASEFQVLAKAMAQSATTEASMWAMKETDKMHQKYSKRAGGASRYGSRARDASANTKHGVRPRGAKRVDPQTWLSQESHGMARLGRMSAITQDRQRRSAGMGIASMTDVERRRYIAKSKRIPRDQVSAYASQPKAKHWRDINRHTLAKPQKNDYVPATRDAWDARTRTVVSRDEVRQIVSFDRWVKRFLMPVDWVADVYDIAAGTAGVTTERTLSLRQRKLAKNIEQELAGIIMVGFGRALDRISSTFGVEIADALDRSAVQGKSALRGVSRKLAGGM